MTREEVSQTYQALEGLEVRLDHVPELGSRYLTDKLMECREKQNQIIELIVKTNKAYSAVLQARRAQAKLVKYATTEDQAARLREEYAVLDEDHEVLKLLLEALNVRRINLVRTSSDIRLLMELMNEALRTGPAAGGKSKEEAPPKAVPPPLVAAGPQRPVVILHGGTTPQTGEEDEDVRSFLKGG